MTTTDRRDADDATFTAEMDRLNRLEVADEGAEERVARAIWDAKEMPADKWTSESPGWAFEREECRAYARAAIAELAAPGTDSSGLAVQRVLDLADELDGGMPCDSGDHGPACNWNAADRIRDAAAGPQRDHGGEGGQ